MSVRLALALLAGLPMPAAAQTPFAPHVPDVLRGYVGPGVEARFVAAEADLDGDGRPEIVALLSGAEFCGSGGCTLVVLAGSEARYRAVARLPLVRLPVRILPETSGGWHDLGVGTGGGGAAAGSARLRFDGASYPGNPTVPPAEPLVGDAGRILIPADAPERQLPRRD